MISFEQPIQDVNYDWFNNGRKKADEFEIKRAAGLHWTEGQRRKMRIKRDDVAKKAMNPSNDKIEFNLD